MSLKNLLAELNAAKINLKSRNISEYKEKIKNAKVIAERLLETDKHNKETLALHDSIVSLIETTNKGTKLASSPMAQTNLKDLLGKIIKKCETLLKNDMNDQIDFEQTDASYSEASDKDELAIFSLELEDTEKQPAAVIQNSKNNMKQPSIIQPYSVSPKRYSKSYKSFFVEEELPLSTDEDSLSSDDEDSLLSEKLNRCSLTSSNYSTTTNSTHWSSASESTSSSTTTHQNDDELEQGSYGIDGSLALLFNR